MKLPSACLLFLVSAFVAHAAERQPVEVSLDTVTRKTASTTIRYFPAARRVNLTPLKTSQLAGYDHLSGRLPIGPKGFEFIVARSRRDQCFDMLYLNAENSGALPAQAQQVKHKLSKGKFYTWFHETVKLTLASNPADVDEIPVQLYLVTEAMDDTPTFIRMRLESFRLGHAVLDGTPTTVYVRDGFMDGIHDQRDWWNLFGPGADLKRPRKISEFDWSAGKAWKLEVLDPFARKVRIVPHDPGLTEKADTIKRDPYHADKLTPKAREAVKFRRDVVAALNEVTGKQTYFLKFETDWCAPCKVMNALVFRAQSVVTAAQGVTCIKVDGDVHKDLVEQHQVTAYPTGILIDAKGNEIRRYRGYRSAEAMTKFFAR